jgi:hypothetical protein
MSKKIEITVAEDGSLSIEAFGYQDGECRLATAPFENAAGSVRSRRTKSNDCEVEVKEKIKL